MNCILIVDDDKYMREFLEELIDTEIGVKTCSAENGISALNIIKENKVDLLVTDVLMPEMDGIELVQKSKKLEPDLKVMLMSGGGSILPSDGGYDYLKAAKLLTKECSIIKKPFLASDFIQAFNKLARI